MTTTVHIVVLEYPSGEEFPDVRAFTTVAGAISALKAWVEEKHAELLEDDESYVVKEHAPVSVDIDNDFRLYCFRVISCVLED